MSESNQADIRFIREVTAGTTPATPTMQTLLRTGGGLKGITDTVVSEAARSDAMRQGIFRTGQHSELSLEVEMAYGQFDTLLESALRGTWTSAITLSGATYSAAAADDSVNDSANGFVAAGIQAGMWLLIDNLHASVDGLLKVATVAAGKLTFTARVPLATGVYTETLNFTDQAAGAAVTIKNAGMLRNSTTAYYHTFEQGHLDVDQFFQARGVRIEDFTLEIAAKSLVKASFTGKGMSFARTGATVANAVTGANSNDAFNTTEDIIGLNEGGSAFTEELQKITLSLKNNLRLTEVVGDLNPVRIPAGTMDLTGQIDIYLASTSGTIIDKYINFTASSKSFIMRNGSSPVYYVITIPAYKYSGGLPEAGGLNEDNMVQLPFTAYNSGGFQIQIDKMSTT